MTNISPAEVLKVQELTQLAYRFRNITNDIDGLNKEVRQIEMIDVSDDIKKDPVKFWDHLSN